MRRGARRVLRGSAVGKMLFSLRRVYCLCRGPERGLWVCAGVFRELVFALGIPSLR